MFTKEELEELYYYADNRVEECRRVNEFLPKSNSYWIKEEEKANNLKLKIQMILYHMN